MKLLDRKRALSCKNMVAILFGNLQYSPDILGMDAISAVLSPLSNHLRN